MTNPCTTSCYTKSANYTVERFISEPIWNNAVYWDERKTAWSDCILRIPAMIDGSLDDVRADPHVSHICYEQYDRGRIVSSWWLQSLVSMSYILWWHHKDIYNHDHALYARHRSDAQWCHLIHIDQHSDLAMPNPYIDIGSFIQPALTSGVLASQEQIRTEYALMHYDVTKLDTYNLWTCIVDIDIDFWAPEMGIDAVANTYRRVRALMMHPSVGIITIATSPTYIDQSLAIQIIQDLLV